MAGIDADDANRACHAFIRSVQAQQCQAEVNKTKTEGGFVLIFRLRNWPSLVQKGALTGNPLSSGELPRQNMRIRNHEEADMRDRDRLESELLELRAVAAALDGSLRRLACGDVSQQIGAPFPRAFEGMRQDFIRGPA